MNVSGIMLNSEHADELGAFYTKVLGEPGMKRDGYYGWMKGAGFMVGPHIDVHGSNADAPRIMISLETDDVQGEFARLLEVGATEVAKPYSPNLDNADMKLATVADPDGNYLQISIPWGNME